MEPKKIKLKVHSRNFSGEYIPYISPQFMLDSLLYSRRCWYYSVIITLCPYSACSEEELIVNCEALTREKWEVRDGDLLEIFPPDNRSESWRFGLA